MAGGSLLVTRFTNSRRAAPVLRPRNRKFMQGTRKRPQWSDTQVNGRLDEMAHLLNPEDRWQRCPHNPRRHRMSDYNGPHAKKLLSQNSSRLAIMLITICRVLSGLTTKVFWASGSSQAIPLALLCIIAYLEANYACFYMMDLPVA